MHIVRCLHLCRPFLGASLLAAFASAQGSVLVVDPAPSSPFQEIQDAVNAASDGDLILVREGSYPEFDVVGKSLTIQGDGVVGVTAPIGLFGGLGGPALEISQIAADQSLVVRGIDLAALSFDFGEYPVTVNDCEGALLFEDCTFTNLAGDAVVLDDAASATFSGCTLDAGNSFYYSYLGVYFTRYGLRAASSNAYLYDCTVQGPVGPDAVEQIFLEIQPGFGGPGVRLTASTLFASGCSIAGGDGGSGVEESCFAGEDGGDGIEFDDASIVRLLDTTVAGGQAGLGSPGGCGLGDGEPGAALDGPPLGVEQLAGTARSFTASAPVVEGTSIGLTFTGEPGDEVVLLIGVEPTPAVYYRPFASVQHLAVPFAGLPLGAVPAGGVLQVDLPIPELNPLFPFQRYPGQALFVTPGAQVFHSGPSVTTLLDSSI
ncbi:MAG: right-handed parallel beta-helix repeat-containing protein [Planctomycetota bacterium]